MRKTTALPFVVLVISAVVMVAGLLLGPDTAGSAFFAISVWLGAFVAHRGGREAAQENCSREAVAATSRNYQFQAHVRWSSFADANDVPARSA